MFNPYQPYLAKIKQIKQEAENIKIFKLELDNPTPLCFQPGQFIELSIPGFGEAPFFLCSSVNSKTLEVCVGKAGQVTTKLHSLKKGSKIGLRGPFGNGWPISRLKQEKKNLLIVVDGFGLTSLRTLLLTKNQFLDRNAKIQLFYGARKPQDFLFKQDYKKWQELGINLNLTIDNPSPGWKGCIGIVTNLFDTIEIVENALAFLCGPPIMYKFVLEKLKEHNFADKDIYLSLERRMQCGIGICQHCAVGSKYVCKDGPIFCYEEIKEIPEII